MPVQDPPILASLDLLKVPARSFSRSNFSGDEATLTAVQPPGRLPLPVDVLDEVHPATSPMTATTAAMSGRRRVTPATPRGARPTRRRRWWGRRAGGRAA